MTKRTRQTAQEAEDTVAVPTPARRSRRTAADNAEQQPEQPPQPHSERPIRTTRRSQQSQQDAAAITPVESPSTRTSSRRQRQQEDNQQIQQQEELQQQLSQQPEIEQQQQHQLGPGQGQQAGNSPAHEAEAAGQLHAATANAASAAADAADAEAEDGPDEQVFDDFSKNGDLAQAVAALSNATADPAAFLQPSSDISQAARQAAKALLQYAITTASFARQQHEQQQEDQQQQQQQPDLQDHQQLYVDDGYDSEQIWYQLDMQLAPLRKRVKKLVGQIAEEGTQGLTSLIAPEFEAGLDAVLDEATHGKPSGDDADELSDEDHDHDMDNDESDLDMDHDADNAAGSSEDEGQPHRKQGSKASAKQKQHLLPVEDRFMRLDEMEAFVAQAEREEAGLEDEDDEGDDELGSDDDVDGTAGGRGAAGSDLGSDDDADLDDLLASSAALVGKKLSKEQKQRKATVSGDDDSDFEGLDGDEDEEDIDPGEIMYKDFFGDDGQPDLDADDIQDDHDDDGMDLGGGDEDAAAASVKGSKDKRKAAAASAGKKRVHWDDDEEDEDLDGDLGDHDGDVMSSDDDDEQQEEAPLSTHERRLLRMQERISQLEDEAMGEKPWHLVGEVSASRRPLNSALEIDMDYDTTNKPPPAPTEEATQSLEEVIKRRIAEARWDDVIRVLPPAPEVKKKQLDLDDTKAQQGLGEIYEAEYVQQATGFTAPDKAEPLRRQALALFKTLCGKLDALSSFAFTPKPVVEELEVRSDVAALAVEEVAPLAVSAADMRTPGEVFTAQAHGEQKAEAELTQEERKRRRARKKRVHKNKEAAKAAEAAARAAATGDASALAGRKSLAAQLAAATSSGLIKKGVPAAGAGSFGKSDFGKSTAVFGKLAEQAAGGVQGKKGAGGKEDKQQLKSAALKL